MKYGIGIDTGGTCTDAVIYDFETKTVLAKGKAPTTRQDLSVGIGAALDMLPPELVRQAEIAALSTTLATNACVENKGGRARLVLMGTDRKTLEWVKADQKYGLNYDDVLCLDTKGSFDGKIVEHPDWEKVIKENDEFFRQAEALSVAELNAMRNGAVCEIAAKDALREKYPVPLVMASELVSDPNVLERGATALLNARLLPVVEQFMQAVTAAFEKRGLNAPKVIIRSDGSLMNEAHAAARPVETILSGPAASVMGSRALADCKSCLIVDMGGTTTDISIIRGGAPEMSGGIRIGGWRTQIKGVFIDTFGLGGDTRLYIHDGRLMLDSRRVEPLCFAAEKWPQIREQLMNLLRAGKTHTQPLHEVLYLVRTPERCESYTAGERALIDLLKDGPQMIGGGKLNPYDVPSARLEQEGVIMRCGLTPTDIMHVLGDYEKYDSVAALLAARRFVQQLPGYEDEQESLGKFCTEAYDLVKRRLFENIARVFVESAYPDLCRGGMNDQLKALIARKWEDRNKPDSGFFDLRFDVSAALVGIGAPTGVFLPDVAKALGAKCVIPDHAEVANAVGAVVANISAGARIEIRPEYNSEGTRGYIVYADEGQPFFEEFDDAVAFAEETAARIAGAEARRRGALGELNLQTRVNARRTHARDGFVVDLGTWVEVVATDRV